MARIVVTGADCEAALGVVVIAAGAFVPAGMGSAATVRCCWALNGPPTVTAPVFVVVARNTDTGGEFLFCDPEAVVE
jgi:hypothetical protein